MDTAPALTIEDRWRIFLTTHDDETRNILLLHYLPKVKYTAERMRSKLPDRIEVEDLVNAGIFGLIKAINKYNPKRRTNFETYSRKRIRGSILDYLRKIDWIPRLVRTRAKQLRDARRMLEAELGRTPTEVELADVLGLDMDEFWRFQRDANAVGLFSLHRAFKDSDEDEFGEIDIRADDKSRNPQLEAQRRDLRDLITKGFSRTEQLIIVLYYYEEMTMKEIGRTLGVSESRVCQMHSSIIARLRVLMDRRNREFDL